MFGLALWCMITDLRGSQWIIFANVLLNARPLTFAHRIVSMKLSVSSAPVGISRIFTFTIQATPTRLRNIPQRPRKATPLHTPRY